MTFRDMYFSRRLNINYSLFAFDISVSCVTKVVNPTETFPILFISCLSNCHSLISIKNMNNVTKGEILMTYKKLFSLYPKFQNVRYACSLQSRKMIGHFNLAKVNFTGCWFQVKIYFKAELP